MKISHEKPINYPHIEEKFGRDIWDRGVVITYGDTIHCKSGTPSPSVLHHEEVHIKQQLEFPGGPAAWWREYIRNDKFRLQEELAAHKEEAVFIRKTVLNHRKRFEKVDYLARSMAANYAGMITYAEAITLL